MLLKPKNDTHTADLRDAFSPHLLQRFIAVRAQAQRRQRELGGKIFLTNFKDMPTATTCRSSYLKRLLRILRFSV